MILFIWFSGKGKTIKEQKSGVVGVGSTERTEYRRAWGNLGGIIVLYLDYAGGCTTGCVKSHGTVH